MGYKTLYWGYDSYTESTGGYDPDDEWSRDSTSTSNHYSHEYWHERENVRTNSYDSFIVPEDLVGTKFYILVATWSTGDSFGHDAGYYTEVIGAFKTAEEASKVGESLESSKDFSEIVDGVNYNIPWNGYFESLDRLEVLEVGEGLYRKRLNG